MSLLAGVDIGGTKCAVCLGRSTKQGVTMIGKSLFPTPSTPVKAIDLIIRELDGLISAHMAQRPEAIGISCGGPLDSRTGLILSPPNLPNWDRFDVVTPLKKQYGVPVALQNDANACALAEWKWGAGKGACNMVFLTFGTGMGAGLILNGKLYTGESDMAGEVGHIRLEQDGPVGYGKAGSFEGFCSGGGIARLAEQMLADQQTAGGDSLLRKVPEITAKAVFEAAVTGDALSLDIVQVVGRHLGRGVALLLDILNPERVVIGSIYARQETILTPIVMDELRREALPQTLASCQIVSAGLQDNVGDMAGLSVALEALEESRGHA